VELSIPMDFTHDFGAEAEAVPSHLVYQDTRDSSSHWRNDVRVWHPLTEKQFGKKFRVGDRVLMRLLYDNDDTTYINLTVVHIMSYETTKQVLGSYNEGDAFKGSPFTHVLVLE
jgi:hypothetical protein